MPSVYRQFHLQTVRPTLYRYVLYMGSLYMLCIMWAEYTRVLIWAVYSRVVLEQPTRIDMLEFQVVDSPCNQIYNIFSNLLTESRQMMVLKFPIKSITHCTQYGYQIKSINQSINHSLNQSIRQSINSLTHSLNQSIRQSIILPLLPHQTLSWC